MSTGVSLAAPDRVVRWGWYSVGINILLASCHGAVALRSGSLAVTAELLHNVVDLAAAALVVIGLKLAARKSRDFPYGLYKVENLVAAGLAAMVFFSAYEVIGHVVADIGERPSVDPWMLVILAATLAIPLVFGHFELRVARAAGSPALAADAREYRMHAYTTGLAFIALLGGWLDLPIDRVAAAVIAIAVVRTGWDLMSDALRVLLDASLAAPELAGIRQAIEADPAIAEVNWITGRNAGRVRFVEAGVSLRLEGLEIAEAAVARIERSLKAELPRIERVLLHVEPRASAHELVAVPLAEPSGRISAHFGDAPYFAFLRLDRATGDLVEQHVCANPHRAAPRAKGILVAEWLVARKVDALATPASLAGKGPMHVLGEAGVRLQTTEAHTVAELLASRLQRG